MRYRLGLDGTERDGMGWDLVWVRARVGLRSGMNVTGDTVCEENEVDIR
jgi:hypothetical protein